MSLEECYEILEADYNDVMSRLITEERVKKYLCKVPGDSNFADFRTKLDEKDYEVAFRCVHNIKGIGLNLGLSKLVEKSSCICEELRHGEPKTDIAPMVEVLYQEYEKIRNTISQIEV